jgi:LmbE family N-acetylglucosaminyl deacetylase
MDVGVSSVGANQKRPVPGPLAAAELAQAIRHLAVEAGRILNHPDATTGELMQIRRRVRQLLRAARGRASQPTEIDRWLRCVVDAIDAKLLCGFGV